MNEIKDVIRSLCKTCEYSPKNKEIESVLIDFSSFESLFSSYSRLCLKKERNQLLLQDMFLFDSEKSPTLEEVGQYFDVTRERVRQVVNRALRQFRHAANISKLEKFWLKQDKAVASGGGVIYLQDLPDALKDAFNWPASPNPYALGQFLSIWDKGSRYKDLNDLIQVDCECLSCEIPGNFLESLDFSGHNSFHMAVIGSRLVSFCTQHCPWKRPKEKFHRAFIEKAVDSFEGLVLYKELVLTRDKWLETYCTKLEDVAIYTLKNHGKPMHFTRLADQIRRTNHNFKNLSDHNLHSSIIKYDSFKIAGRGTYGLASWQTKTYRSVSTAIENFLDTRGLPQRRKHILRHLDGEFADGNITAALNVETRFKNIGDGIYDGRKTWQNRTLEEFNQVLPDPVDQFVQYLIRRNNTSYKLVMAFIFIRSMDETGAIYLNKLKTMFYNFYLSRHKKGLPVESKSATMHRIDELDKTEMINLACKEPLKSFLGSGYFTRFSQKGRKLKLIDTVLNKLDIATRDLLIITILKALDDYFLVFTPKNMIYKTPPPEKPDNVSETGVEREGSFMKMQPDNPAGHVHIKKKRRGKIKL